MDKNKRMIQLAVTNVVAAAKGDKLSNAARVRLMRAIAPGMSLTMIKHIVNPPRRATTLRVPA